MFNHQKLKKMKKTTILMGVILTLFFLTSCYKVTEIHSEAHSEAHVTIFFSSVSADTIVHDTVVIKSKVTLTDIELSNTAATIKGVVEGAVGQADFAYGICWSVSPNPTLENNYSNPIQFEKPDRFEITISNLKVNTKYYVRPYILQSNQYYYGDISGEFTTGY